MPPTTTAYADDTTRWTAVCGRERAADGLFFTGVHTTGIYCRPSCGARRPLRSNVSFFATTEAARAAGLRACKRCRPDEATPAGREAALVAAACRTLDAAEAVTPLAALAQSAGMSPHHFHRLFRRTAGVTPKAYADGRRAERARAALEEGATVTDAVYAAGFGAPSRFYAAADDMLGMAPADYAKGGRSAQVRYALAPSSLGLVLVAATDRGVADVRMGEDPEALVGGLRTRLPAATLAGDDPAFMELVTRVVAAVEGEAPAVDLPLDIQGTAFQRRVWDELRRIPWGGQATYSQIAAAVGAPAAVRAVGTACGANPVAVLVPCHRAIRTDGGLGGYRWGLGIKTALLERERRGPG